MGDGSDSRSPNWLGFLGGKATPARAPEITRMTIAVLDMLFGLGDDRVRAARVEYMDLGGWLRSLGLEQYEATFRENAINEKVLPNLTAEDLKDMGVSVVG